MPLKEKLELPIEPRDVVVSLSPGLIRELLSFHNLRNAVGDMLTGNIAYELSDCILRAALKDEPVCELSLPDERRPRRRAPKK